MKNGFTGLDWLRFLLALYLVAFHTIIQYPGVRGVSFFHIFYFGGFATSTFFVISGFILTHVYLGDGTSGGLKGGTRAFLVKRFATIYPIHIISLLLIVATAGLSIHSALEVESIVLTPDTFAPHTMTLRECITMLCLQIFLLQAWYPYYLAFNYPAWSLSTLAFFYAVFPFISVRLFRYGRAEWLLLAVWLLYLAPPVAALLAGWHSAWMEGVLHVNPLVRLPEFVAGILAYRLVRSASGVATFVAAWRLHIVAVAVLAFFCGAYLFSYGAPYWKYLLHNGALLPVQVMLVIACATSPLASNAGLTRLSRRLGNAALSIFLLHAVIFKLFNGVQKMIGTSYPVSLCMRHVRNCIESSHHVDLKLVWFPLFLCVTVVISIAFQERVVAPLRQWIERRLASRRCASAHMAAPIESVDPAQPSGL